MLNTVFDTAPLITCCRFIVQDRPVIDYILDSGCRITVPPSVQDEITVGRNRYPDARIAEERLQAGYIAVHNVSVPQDNVLNLYGLGRGEQSVIALAIAIESEIDYVILDDKLAYIVCDRLGLAKLFLLDLLVNLVINGMVSDELAREVCQVVAPRYSHGMITHTLRILEKGERKWLK